MKTPCRLELVTLPACGRASFDYFAGMLPIYLRRNHLRNYLSALLGLAVFGAVECARAAGPDSANTDVDTNEVAVINTSEGTIVIGFWKDAAPKTIANFKKLARQGFYDGTLFHRVIKGFMIQGGDPKTKDAGQEMEWGTGDPGYKLDAEFNDHSHVRGVISMARSRDPNSAGSQFFICHGSPTQLDHQYTTFGRLLKGDDVLEKIATTPTHIAPGHVPDRPDKPMKIISIKIVPGKTVL
jgi:peptidyl-prolyl cis-trans isomerase B (cyclophilin B)